MKTHLFLHAAVLCLAAVMSLPANLAAQGTAFTYQGRLTHGESAATGLYEVNFALYDAATDGNVVGTRVTVAPVSVSNGLFIATLDFGANAFTGNGRWLEIAVTVFGSDQPPVTFHPRQPITATPYAFIARGVIGPISATQLTGTVAGTNLAGGYTRAVAFTNTGNFFAGNGARLTEVNATTLNGVPSTAFWRTNGNMGANPTNGAFLGTTDNLPLEFKANGLRALRLEPAGDSNDGNIQPDGAPNVIGGSPVNFVAGGAVGVTISGGGAINFGGGASPNSADSHYTTVSGGRGNTIPSGCDYSTISGGSANGLGSSSPNSTISGGNANYVEGLVSFATVSGGGQNKVHVLSDYATIGGGGQNAIQNDSDYATINGGYVNTVLPAARAATISGGRFNTISLNAASATISGGESNTIETNAFGATIGGGALNLIQNDAAFAAIGGGKLNTIESYA